MQIFPNGTMRYTNASGTADLDSNGLPVAASGAEQSCQCTISVLAEDRKGRYDDGRYRNCSYSVTCNLEEVSETFNPTSVRLEHEFKGDLGYFTVQRVEFYKLTGTGEVWV